MTSFNRLDCSSSFISSKLSSSSSSRCSVPLDADGRALTNRRKYESCETERLWHRETWPSCDEQLSSSWSGSYSCLSAAAAATAVEAAAASCGVEASKSDWTASKLLFCEAFSAACKVGGDDDDDDEKIVVSITRTHQKTQQQLRCRLTSEFRLEETKDSALLTGRNLGRMYVTAPRCD